MNYNELYEKQINYNKLFNFVKISRKNYEISVSSNE